ARGKIISETLSYRLCLRRPSEARYDCILNGVAELMEDRFAVFRLVDFAVAVGEQLLAGTIPCIVLLRSVDIDPHRFAEDRALVAVPQLLEIMDRLIDVVIDHHLLEALLVRPERKVEIAPPDAAFRARRAGGHPFAF